MLPASVAARLMTWSEWGCVEALAGIGVFQGDAFDHRHFPGRTQGFAAQVVTVDDDSARHPALEAGGTGFLDDRFDLDRVIAKPIVLGNRIEGEVAETHEDEEDDHADREFHKREGSFW